MSESGTSSEDKSGGIRQRALQEELKELVDVVGPAPLVDLLLERAFQLSATDIHLDPNDGGLRVRLRVDGLLHDVALLPLEMTSHVISRVKLMANMDITERRLAQDGHIANAVLQQQRNQNRGIIQQGVQLGALLGALRENFRRTAVAIKPDSGHIPSAAEIQIDGSARASVGEGFAFSHFYP